jgi:hypothetical protein
MDALERRPFDEAAPIASAALGRDPARREQFVRLAMDRAQFEAQRGNAFMLDPNASLDDVDNAALRAAPFFQLARAWDPEVETTAALQWLVVSAASSFETRGREMDLAHFELIDVAVKKTITEFGIPLATSAELLALTKHTLGLARARERVTWLVGALDERDERLPCARFVLGRLLVAADEKEGTRPDAARAVTVLEAALGKDTRHPDGAYWTRHWLACALLDLGRDEEAEQLLSDFPDPPSDDAVVELRVLLGLRHGKRVTARALVQFALARHPEEGSVLREVLADLDRGKAGEARELLEARLTRARDGTR